MSFLAPIALLLGLLALPIILLYMLRLRRQEVLVSSTFLWQKLLRDREANAPWQKLRKNLLLILQLLILLALILALARPFVPVPSVVSGSVVVLLDASASMQATDMERSRFEAARRIVSDWIGELGGDDRMTLIQVGQTPQVLASASGDPAALEEALARAAPTSGEADWASALALAGGAAQGFQEARIVIVSDGGLPGDLPPLPAEVVYVPVGESDENLAITALATRETAGGPQLFASVVNLGSRAQQTLISIKLDNVLFDSRPLTVPAGQTENLTWELPADVATVEAHLSEQTEDYLVVDDQAWAVHEGGLSNQALLVTPGNVFLEQVYSVLPGVEAFKSDPESVLEAAAAEGEVEVFDLYVFDSTILPETLPDGDLLIINPQQEEALASAQDALFTVTGLFTDTTVTRVADSPLLQFVDWGGVGVRQAQQVNAPWATTLVEAEGGPLLLAGEWEGGRVAILTFDLHDSDLPLQIAFPVLMANITGWLNPGRAFDAPTGLRPGDPVRITPGAATTVVQIEPPAGDVWTEAVGEDAVVFAQTGQPGLYQVFLRDPGGDRPAGVFAVNLFSTVESTIRPALEVQVGQRTADSESEADVGQRELWPWLAALGFFILAIEWWVHFRGPRLPRMGLKREA